MSEYKFNRIFTIVMDSLGIGAMEDSPRFGDVGVDTLGHISEQMNAAGEAFDKREKGVIICPETVGRNEYDHQAGVSLPLRRGGPDAAHLSAGALL